MLGSRMARAADADHFLFAVAADEFTGENEIIDIFLLPGKVLVCIADRLNGLPCVFIDQLRVDVGIDGIAVPDFSGIFCIAQRSGGDTMDKEERQVVVNGKPILEQLSKEEADAFYVVLLLQVQNMYMKKQAEGRKGFQV